MSEEGLAKLMKHEALIDGLYEDQVGFCTYGVGHLVHKDKWPSFVLAAAATDERWKDKVDKKYGGKVKYVARLRILALENLSELEGAAVESAKEIIAQRKHKKEFNSLTPDQQKTVHGAAQEAVKREIRLLPQAATAVYRQDIREYEQAVNEAITGAELAQEEFEALVSFAFNVGAANLKSSNLAKLINQNRFRSGDDRTRQQAIRDIEAAFLSYNTSKVKGKRVVVDDLTQRRKDEATRFLWKARTELSTTIGVGGGMALSRD
jgi:GH24 family phage-related lysozyme (muramidase)